MDISYFWILAFSIAILLAVLRYIKIGNYDPDKVFQNLGDSICVNYSAIGSKTLPKSSVVKIQLAGNCISLFNQSDNALDIYVPGKLGRITFLVGQEQFSLMQRL
ncbi:hypothetical protein CA267_003785 [Alteromonas pelagimontana]|uniref:Uncharacterized protein n=1 Tax=Alteromonas pelagimontana TaxID=1858656 RepID=A0A6M4M9X1_9ALTE|nr:hypothetical protein [Alteromonas pelagimontana]QJR79963.1 hypothetical protein CA267_003785 [Alteromonas pelagimontana]